MSNIDKIKKALTFAARQELAISFTPTEAEVLRQAIDLPAAAEGEKWHGPNKGMFSLDEAFDPEISYELVEDSQEGGKYWRVWLPNAASWESKGATIQEAVGRLFIGVSDMAGEDDAEVPPTEEEMFVFLERIRGEGAINMFEADSLLQSVFGLGKNEAKSVLFKWMNSQL